MIIIKNYLFLKHHIMTCRTKEQLITCRWMIADRLEPWGVDSIVETLVSFIQIREAELIGMDELKKAEAEQ